MRDEVWQGKARRGWTGRGGAKLQFEIFKSCGIAGRERGQQRGVGERRNAVDYKTNTEPGTAIERVVMKQNTK